MKKEDHRIQNRELKLYKYPVYRIQRHLQPLQLVTWYTQHNDFKQNVSHRQLILYANKIQVRYEIK